MTELNGWLSLATRRLSSDSTAQVRTEIEDHYQSARDAALDDGATPEEAHRSAVKALGDPRAANRQYRKVLLTSVEAKVLRDAGWEGRAVCSRPWLKRVLPALPAAALLASACLFLNGMNETARVLLAGGIGLALLAAAPFLPVYTPLRGRLFRVAKWVLLGGIFTLAFGIEDSLKWSWLMASCLWPMVWIEWTRASIRRKMRRSDWPKALYL